MLPLLASDYGRSFVRRIANNNEEGLLRPHRSSSRVPMAFWATLAVACGTDIKEPGVNVADAGRADSPDADTPSSNVAGPTVLQMMVLENLDDVGDGSIQYVAARLAFGTHPHEYFSESVGFVEGALPSDRQEIRVVLDKPINRYTLQEVSCIDGSISRIPASATFEEIENCTANAIYNTLASCTTICIGSDGMSVGIADYDRDYVPDFHRMIDFDPSPEVTEFGVHVTCDGIPIPFDPVQSIWKSEGSQELIENNWASLGPVISLKPISGIGLRSNATCLLRFRSEVVDRGNNEICVPVGGAPSNTCMSSEDAAISFGTEPIEVFSSSISDGATDVPTNACQFILLEFNAHLDSSTLDAITLTADGTPVPVSWIADEESGQQIRTFMDEGCVPGAVYELTLDTGLKDVLGGTLPASVIRTWTTAAQ